MFDVSPGAHEPLADLAATAGARIEEELHEKRLLKPRRCRKVRASRACSRC
jgi:hypothetical protein